MSVVLFDGPLHELLNGRDGPVAVLLGQKLQACTNSAVVNATGRPGPNVITDRLRSSLAWELGRDSRGLYGDFGTNVPYGFWLETGLRNGAKYPFLMPAAVQNGLAMSIV